MRARRPLISMVPWARWTPYSDSLSLALQAAHAEDLALVQIERHVAQSGTVPQIAHRQQRALRGRRNPLRVEAFARAAKHHAHDLVIVQFTHRAGANMPAVAEDGAGIGDLTHLTEAM